MPKEANIVKDLNKYVKVKEGGRVYIDSGLQEMEVGTFEKKEESLEELKSILGDVYEKILEVLKEYSDLRDEYYHLVATWIIGTYFHDSFNTYPYLFLNAMRGGGKTRLLKIISKLSKNGEIIGSPTEAVLFRIPKGSTLCIDEFEGITRKGNEGLREVLNASYKKGMKIRRMKKKKTEDGETHVVEEFEPYKPICLANIWGMEEVLGDRCITLILEKSSRKDIMRIIEDFDEKPVFHYISTTLDRVLVKLCSYFSVYGYIKKWNLYIKSKYYTLHTLTTLNTDITENTSEIEKEFEEFLDIFNAIDETGINGRNLELFFPLLIIGHYISSSVFEKILQIAKSLTKEKREEEMIESKDVALIDFVSRQDFSRNYRSIKLVTNEFRLFLGDDEKDECWLNTKWVGRALKRLGLVLDKRRVGEGIEVTLAVDKAKQKIKDIQLK